MSTAQIALFLVSFLSTVVLLVVLIRSPRRHGGPVPGNHGSPTNDRI